MFSNAATSATFAAYLYTVIVFVFVIFYIDVVNNNRSVFFYDLHLKSLDYLSRVTFFLVISTLLGTPVTLGFFLKVIVFSNIILGGKVLSAVAVLLNLVLVIFYLQAVRQNQIQRKTRKTLNNVEKNLRTLSVYSCIFLINSVFLVVIFSDIIYSFF